jgi:hypothetical protein
MTVQATELPRNQEKAFFPCEATDLTFFETAPVLFRFTQELPVTPTVLFDIFEDPASWPKWGTGIGNVEWTSPKPYRAGTTRTVTFWGGMEVYEKFLAFDRGREMAFVFYGHTQRVWNRFGEHYGVEDLGDGTCRLTWTVAYDPAGTFAKIHPIIGWIMRGNLRSYLWRLRGHCRRHTQSR